MTSVGGPVPGFRRWWLVGVVLLVVVSVAVAVASNGVQRTVRGHPQSAPLTGLPEQSLLTSPMRQRPVHGWQVTAGDLGLPGDTIVKPFGNVGSRGFFLATHTDGSWLVGIDVDDGRPLFAPVWLAPPERRLGVGCFVNGPSMVLCVQDVSAPDEPGRAWVVDTEAGALTFDGPTDLRISLAAANDAPKPRQVGDYVVATVTGEGMHGVGSRAELTWFVPGDGLLGRSLEWERDVAPPTLAVQGGPGRSLTSVVFSAADGKVVKPSTPEYQPFGHAIAYPGGVGYEYRLRSDTLDRAAFFDDSGKELSRPEPAGTLLRTSLDVPMVETESKLYVFTLDGRLLLEIPRPVLMVRARLIGTRLFVTSGIDTRRHSWQQYDLRTGAAGQTCDVDLGFAYIASDGDVAIINARGTSARAIDLSTCEPLWSLPGETTAVARDVWKVNTTLIERTDSTLSSLVAPK